MRSRPIVKCKKSIELNYLAKRLDGFDMGEATQFQAMAHKLELSELKDLINLSHQASDT